jgi:hypothetical protein
MYCLREGERIVVVLGRIRLLVCVVYTDSRLVSTHIFVGGWAEFGTG